MTIIVSAFPCLGKTTLTSQNKDIYFDAELYESRATKGMSESQQKEFFKASALKNQVDLRHRVLYCYFCN